jgi:ribonucleoside-diphosphate reductase alpha chain
MNFHAPAVAFDRPDYHYLNDVALKTLSRGYLRDGIAKADLKQAAIDRLDVMIAGAEAYIGHKLLDLRLGARRGWVSPASPVWSNFNAGRGLPISCNGSYLDDDMDSILWKNAEIGAMTKEGAGTSLYMGALRKFGSEIAGGGVSEGPVHFARLPQEQVTVVSQGNTRRGNCAIWLDVEHADIGRWMDMRSTAGGIHHPIQHLSFGVVIGDKWMEEMLAEPKGGEKRSLMARIRNKRRETGFPYIMFRDAANDGRPQVLKDAGLLIYASNLCSEIMLPSGPDLSFVCDLSSVNLLYFDEWKGTNFVKEMIIFLDAVMEEYIEKTEGKRLLADARRFAITWRALGLGTLGYHSALQAKGIPFESQEARDLNIEMHRHVQEESIAGSRYLALKKGEPEAMKGTGMRNLTVNAIAPTTSSSIIVGGGALSQSIEPLEANVFENDNAKGVFTQRNPQLQAVLATYGKDDVETWTSILTAGGSVQHLDFLTERERATFKTFIEISQTEIIIQAADRQKFLDQSQSLNIKLPATATMKEDVDLIVLAWKLKLKSLYYRRGVNKAQDLARQNTAAALPSAEPTDCLACEA